MGDAAVDAIHLRRMLVERLAKNRAAMADIERQLQDILKGVMQHKKQRRFLNPCSCIFCQGRGP